MLVLVARVRWHEVLLFAYAGLVGSFELAGLSPAPAVLRQVLSGWGVATWEVTWALHGVLGIVACSGRLNIRLSYRLEQAALLIGAGPLIFYSASILTVSHVPGVAAPTPFSRLVGAGLIGAWGLANLARARQVQSELSMIPIDRE